MYMHLIGKAKPLRYATLGGSILFKPSGEVELHQAIVFTSVAKQDISHPLTGVNLLEGTVVSSHSNRTASM